MRSMESPYSRVNRLVLVAMHHRADAQEGVIVTAIPTCRVPKVELSPLLAHIRDDAYRQSQLCIPDADIRNECRASQVDIGVGGPCPEGCLNISRARKTHWKEVLSMSGFVAWKDDQYPYAGEVGSLVAPFQQCLDDS